MLKTFANKTEMSDYAINTFRNLCAEKGIDRSGQMAIMIALVNVVKENNIAFNDEGLMTLVRAKIGAGLKASRKVKIAAFYQLAAKGFIQ